MASPLKALPFNVFISSKDELVDERAAVESAVLDLNLIPVRVETSTWLATPMPDEYLQQIRKSQLVVLVLAPVQATTVTKDYYKYVRAEVDLAFAEGKTVLLFVRRGSGSQEQDELLSHIQHKVFAREFADTSELYLLVRLSVLNELVRRYSTEPFLFKNRRYFYEFAATFVPSAHIRLVVSQLTPIILLGPRRQLPYENLLYEALMEVVKRSSAGPGPEVTIIYNETRTAHELRDNSSQYHVDRFSEYCGNLRRFVSERASIAAGPDDLIPFVVVDHRYAVGQAVGRRTIVIVNEGAQICTELCEIAKTYATDPPEAGIDRFEQLVQENLPVTR